ncbi:hypothetical protein F0L74_11770 [Chitinophaga agrisoli]|uniref:PKD domain-containing protein n=1 Tax=Chitinophaga agrisoli TaxID=2607653 RepID=A0A5B2VYD7_9BACT|nr:hypothetical protein [Chitinophaga agrisoli]KAA2243186.1 hypothetical protein F0L74_11770 [Chitinophaga agrisoli]
MCKSLFGILFLLLSFTAFSQTNLQVKKDTITVQKGELVIENKTSDTLGYLYNTGNGRTAFKRLQLVNLGDTALAIVGQDTITYKSASIGKSVQFKVGEGTGTPVAGDTSYTNNGFRLGNVKVWRNGLFQYRDLNDGVMMDSLSGKIRFYPALAQGDRVYIESLYGVSLSFQLSEPIPVVTVRDTAITLPNSGLVLTPGIDTHGATINSYQWMQLSGPSSSTITNATTATCTITGLVSGTYAYRLTVTTTGGKQASDDFTVQVNTAAEAMVLRVNFSNTPAPAVPGWFNVYGPVNGNHITATDPVTGWTVDNGGAGPEYWTGFGTGTNANSNDTDGAVTGDNSGIVPDIVLQSFWFNYSKKYDSLSNLIISGLDAQKSYKVKLVASRKSGVTGPRYGVWRINGGQELLQSAIDNVTQQMVVGNVIPDAEGKIKIAMYSPVDSATYGDFSYLNALIIEQEAADVP